MGLPILHSQVSQFLIIGLFISVDIILVPFPWRSLTKIANLHLIDHKASQNSHVSFLQFIFEVRMKLSSPILTAKRSVFRQQAFIKHLLSVEQLPFHFSLSCIGEGNGSQLQCSCLEKPRDGEAWLAAVYGVAQGRT